MSAPSKAANTHRVPTSRVLSTISIATRDASGGAIAQISFANNNECDREKRACKGWKDEQAWLDFHSASDLNSAGSGSEIGIPFKNGKLAEMTSV